MKILSTVLIASVLLFSCGEEKKEDKKSDKEKTEKKSESETKEEVKNEEPKAEALNCDCFTQLTDKHNELIGYLEKADAKEVVYNENLNAAIHNILMDIRNIGKECHADKTAEELMGACDNYQGYVAAQNDLKQYQALIDEATK